MWEYGFSGHQVPMFPRTPRSGRGLERMKYEDHQKESFETLAIVADKFLQGRKTSPTNKACGKNENFASDDTIEGEQNCERDPLKQDTSELGSCDEKSLTCVPRLQWHNLSYPRDENLLTYENCSSKFISDSENLDHSEMTHAERSDIGETFYRKLHYASQHKQESCSLGSRTVKGGAVLLAGSSKYEMETESFSLVSSGKNMEESLLGNHANVGQNHFHCSYRDFGNRDDDQKYADLSKPQTIREPHGAQKCAGDGRIMKLSSSRHWSGSQNLKDREPMTDYCDWDGQVEREIPQSMYPFKKRKFFYQSSFSISNEGSRYKNTKTKAQRQLHSLPDQKVPLQSSDCKVKLGIKSLKVPELFVDIPASATVGSLKRTVMEAVTSFLGEGLHIGVLLQGKKVGDDSKTLLQSGISRNNKKHNLGFILEPSHAQIMSPSTAKEAPALSLGMRKGSTRHSGPSLKHRGKLDISQFNPVKNLISPVGNESNPASSFVAAPRDDALQEAGPIVAVPEIGIGPLAVVPLHKSQHSGFAQRRARRPFSVSEVEALVLAVEKLGTGRWRDVKWHAFDAANHRTYVDLKDKWKTLVHTARISPQQRRGEPVPQELLDRVLAAHAFWSKQHTKQQVKSRL